ncbi:MAG: hypothetical protein FD134_2801 [Gallionellaceae bacterium]|nr:MAG: hypothetical protein FD134_2801 [Gallionellaceae bacterium]
MNEENSGDEVSLLELIKVLLRYKWLLLGLPFVGAVLALILVSFVLRPTWEASAVLEIGRVGQVGQVGQVLVEPASNVVTRMMLPSFAKGSMVYAEVSPDTLNEAQGLYKTLKAVQVKGSELVEVKVRGFSEGMARKLMQASIAHLQKKHTEMMSVSIERVKKQLRLLDEDIRNVGAEAELLKKKLLASHNWNAFDATLSATLLKDKSMQLRSMIQEKLLLEEQLTPSRSYTTRMIDDIYVSEEPVSPNKPLIVALAILAGLLAGVLVAFAHHAIARGISGTTKAS